MRTEKEIGCVGNETEEGALGTMPAACMPGAEQGGILRVKSNMELEAVPMTRESSDHLLEYTAFDMPSFPRWLAAKNLTALEITSPGKAVLILPWQIKWKAASSPK